MAIDERVMEAVEAQEATFKSEPSYVSLKTFYINMQAKGLVVKSEYNLPQTDTIGRSLYQENNHGITPFSW